MPSFLAIHYKICTYWNLSIPCKVQIPLNPSVSILLNVWKLSPLHILIFGSELLTIRLPTNLNVLQFIMWPLASMSLLWILSNKYQSIPKRSHFVIGTNQIWVHLMITFFYNNKHKSFCTICQICGLIGYHIGWYQGRYF